MIESKFPKRLGVNVSVETHKMIRHLSLTLKVSESAICRMLIDSGLQTESIKGQLNASQDL